MSLFKYVFMKRLFIFDVDGVLLDLWTSMRAVFANYHGMSLSDEDWDNIIEDFLHDPEPYLEFGDYFHQSQTFRNLLPVKGMPELVFELRDRCFDLAIISSSDPNFAAQRRKNIEEHYADCFEKIICVGMKQTKEDAFGKLRRDMTKFSSLMTIPATCRTVSALLPAQSGKKTGTICFYGRALTTPA